MPAALQTKDEKRRTPKELIGRIVLYAMLLLCVLVNAICVFNALKWINKPFPGFLINERMMVAPVGQYHWTGTQSGLKYPDKILKANGKRVPSAKELERIINQTRLGDSITYEVDSQDGVFEVKVPTMRFALIDLLMTFGVTFIPGLTFIIIGLTVFVMKPDIRVSWAFLIACLFLSLWAITVFDVESTHFGFIRLYLLSAALFPAAFVHFSFYFPEPRKFIHKYPYIQIFPYLAALGLIVPMEVIYPKPGFGIFYSLSLAYMIVAALFVLYPVTVAYFKRVSALSRQRAKVVLFGAAIAFPIPAIAQASQLIFGSFLGVRIQTNFLALALIFFPASIAYAITKHNLFDVDVYIKRTVGYAIMTAIVVGAYLLLSLSLNLVVGRYVLVPSRAFPILFTLGVILVFNPLRDRIQRFVDRVFFRKEYNYSEIVDKIGGAMTSYLDLSQILNTLVETFTKDMFIDTSSVMLLDTGGAGYRVFLAEGDNKSEVENLYLNREEPLVRVIESEKKEITKYDMLEGREYRAVSESSTASFEALHASLIMPLIYQERMIGLLNLGEKKSGKFYNREDIDLLRTISNQGAVAIENARLFQENLEKQRMEEELAIGRELQMSMLPAECPQIEGFEIAAYSESAREVGGDFYDFIEISATKSGIVIGDVTGKSVSGALVMSASRSIFRMLGENELTVSESMIRANRRTKKDTKTGMFVALLYAVLSSADKSLILCSAGQTQPIFRSAASGETMLVETEGDSFPLGIIDDADYEETRLQLEAGDKVVLYTDGVVEAMNDKEEMYGFDRLLEAIKNSRSKTAESLLEEINRNVNEFADGALQHDDITIIVIQAT